MTNDFQIVVQATYEDYESDNAVFFPLRHEDEQGTRVREVLGRSVGQSVRKRQNRYFRKSFDLLSFHDMRPEHLIQYVIAQTIKEAELAEFDRWFKVEGEAIFEKSHQS